MITPRLRYSISRVSALSLALALSACASAPSRLASHGPAPLARPSIALDTDAAATAEVAAPTIRFDNQAQEHVRVYLVDQRRQWLLGRVEPGARTTLRIPAAALSDDGGPVRLSVLLGDRMTGPSAGQPRVATMAPEPLAMVLSQRWAFSQTFTGGQLTWLAAGARQTP